MKISRHFTCVKPLKQTQTRVVRLLEPLQPLRNAGKLRPLLWQSAGLTSAATSSAWPSP